MSLNDHINKTCSKTVTGLYNIRQIRKFLSTDTTKILVHAFVTSHLDICNSLLFGLPAYQQDRLQKVLNAAAWVICFIPKHDHITPTLIKLHWLPVKQRIDFKIALLVFKAVNGLSPVWLIYFRFSQHGDINLDLMIKNYCSYQDLNQNQVTVLLL